MRRNSIAIGRYLSGPLARSMTAAVGLTAGAQKAARMIPPGVMAIQGRIGGALRVCEPISRALHTANASARTRCPQIDREAARRGGYSPRNTAEVEHGEED
ncbi:MAG TPA: hypothetical protein VFI02_22045 [Armatimonadota bacterium]|nr:hypothetical protein [Armatimonadota bacterium]